MNQPSARNRPDIEAGNVLRLLQRWHDPTISSHRACG
jgi:hypothetical protein